MCMISNGWLSLATPRSFQEVVSFGNLCTHIRSCLYTLVPIPLAEIEFTLRVANSLSDRTPSKRGLSMSPNHRKSCKNMEKKEKEIEKQNEKKKIKKNNVISGMIQSESRAQSEGLSKPNAPSQLVGSH